MARTHLDRNEGYTLLELMTAVAIAGILATIAFPSLKRMQTTRAAKASATQVAGMLSDARTAALTEGTPHLVYFNTAEAPAADGSCPTLGVEVRDVDHSYSITPGDTTRELHLPSDACDKVKPFDAVSDVTPEIAAVSLPADDQATRAPDVASAAAASGNAQGNANGGSGSANSGSGSSNSGNGNSGSSNSGSGNANANLGNASAATPNASTVAQAVARSATVAETVVNGATFPVDANDGRPVVAFSERGIPVDPANPTQWGSGAGAVYLTDGESTVVAAVVAPLGGIQLRVFDPASGEWR